MAVYQFSALSDGQAISFNPSVDRLNFDQTNVAAGDLTLSMEGSNLRVTVKSGAQTGKDVLLNNTSFEQIAGGTNFTFADGSVIRVGDNTVGTVNDQNPNFLSGGTGRDLLMGLQGEDNLQGGDNNDSLMGGTGNDALSGNNGNDWLNGESAVDTLNGGGGQDAFILDHFGSANADLLADFSTGWDNIQLDTSNAIFTQLGAAGRFAAGDARFWAAAGATGGHDADDRIIYNTTTRQIFYDADGNGSDPAQLIATLGTGRTVVASDFWVAGTPPGGGGGNTINGTAGDDTLIGTAGPDTINGLGGNDSLNGLDGADSLNGGDGNDTLSAEFVAHGDGVADTLDGGMGDDVYIVHDDGDVIVADPGGIDTVQIINGDWTLGAGLDNLELYDSGFAPDGTGNELNNIIRGGTEGGTLSGLGGNDWLVSRNTNGSMQLFGGDGDDTLDGGSDDSGDELDGGAGNDVLDGGGGPDVLTGGAGADHFVIHDTNAQDAIPSIQDFVSGTDKVRLDATRLDALGTSGNFAVNDARFFAGGAAHDADDRVIWDGSNLWYDADGTGSISQERLAWVFNPGGANVVATDIIVDNGSAGGSTINGTPGNDSLVGGAGNDTINGFAGNDTLDGQGGADSLVGGTGDDIYEVDNSADVIVEAENAGIDTVHSTVDYELGAFVNNLVLMGAGAVAIGNQLDNILSTTNSGHGVQLDGLGGNDTLEGSFSDDELNGWSGDDFMNGGAGNDVFDTQSRDDGIDTMFGGLGDDRFFASPGDSVNGGDGTDTVFARSSWTLGATEENLVLHTGTDDHDLVGVTAVGNASNNLIDAGFDVVQSTFDGKAGNDTLIGGGDDIDFLFSVSPGAANADVIIDFVTGTNSIVLDGAVHANSGPSGVFAAGDARFWAAAGANTGHDADDRVVYNTGTGQLWYDADGSGAGAAQLIATLQGAPTLSATNIEIVNGGASGTINGTPGDDSLVGSASNDTINGNAGNDTLRGNAGDDSLDGGSGTDLLDGGLGNDIFVVQAGDTLVDAGGNDTVVALNSWALGSGFENLILATGAIDGSGNSASNVIQGNAANNTLRARDGNDTVTGGAGNDFFDFTTAPSAANADTITDFATVDQLRFDDAAFTAIGATGTWAATDGRFFAAAGATSGHDVNDRVIYNTTTGALYYDADGSGTGAAQLVATLQGAPTVSATDITVI